MPLAFDIDNITVAEFGVGRDGENAWNIRMVPVDGGVQTALGEMARATWEEMQHDDEEPVEYQPSEKHAGTEYLSLARGNNLEAAVRELYDAENVPIEATALNEPGEIVYYFGRFVDAQGRRMIALKRAGQFKGMLKNHLLWIVDDSLQIIEDTVFKLDKDFDLLVDSEQTHIWRPSAFEFVGGLKQAVLDAVPGNVAAIQREVTFVDFERIQRFAGTHPRAARYLASIRNQDLAGVARQALLNLCENTGVQLEDVNGLLRVEDAHVMGFLEVLDRRRYEVALVPGERECFRATSRRRL